MVPAGYLAKHVAQRPATLRAERVSAIGSVSGCLSRNFADYITFWQHNGYWLFDSPEVIVQLARAHGLDLAGTSLFYYEVYPLQFDGTTWARFEPEPSFGLNVRLPQTSVLEGFDVVTFAGQSSPECSPLSCNGLASSVETNARCLLPSFERAQALLESGVFSAAEPGPYRIFAVFSVQWPNDLP